MRTFQLPAVKGVRVFKNYDVSARTSGKVTAVRTFSGNGNNFFSFSAGAFYEQPMKN